jgi:predicted nucleic acid-binding protein
MKPQPDTNVMAWLNAQAPASVWLTTITVAELRYGAARLDPGRKRSGLEGLISAYVEEVFKDRIASFDLPATVLFAERAANARRKGSMVEFADGAIAAIALARGFAVATRDARPFIDMGVEVIDPWTSPI